MIPLKDDQPRYSTPFVTWFLMALNISVFLFEIALDDQSHNLFVYQFGVIPTQVTHSLANGSLGHGLLPILTSMFLHDGWWHIVSNMWVLWIFGDNVEDHLGHFRYLVFYIACGVAGTVMHIAFSLGSGVPTVGASGAIAGVMGAYFLLYPTARVLSFFIVFFTWLPAWLVLGYWFIVQFLSGTATVLANASKTPGGIAFWAHVGGFATGIALVKLLPRRRMGSRVYQR